MNTLALIGAVFCALIAVTVVLVLGAVVSNTLIRPHPEPPAADNGPPAVSPPPRADAYPPSSARRGPLPGLAPGQPAPHRPAAPGHGGLITEVRIYADERTEIINHATGQQEIFPGDCAACQDGTQCNLCGYYPAYDPLLCRYVKQYRKCPAHTEPEQSHGR